MTILGFSLPPDSGEKIGLEITTLLAIIMFSQIITGLIPESSLSVPKIAIYFASVVLISTISIVANVFVLIFHHRNVKIQQPMPKWIDTLICNYLAKILRMKPIHRSSDKKEKKSKKELAMNNVSSAHDSTNELSSKSLLANVLDINDDFGVVNKASYFNKLSSNSIRSKLLNEQTNNVYSQYQNNMPYLRKENGSLSQSFDYSGDVFVKEKNDVSLLRRNLTNILKEIRVITNKIKDDEDDEKKSLNWKFAAMVIDRLCMYTFAIATFLSTVLILLTSKNFFSPSDPDERF